MRIIDADTLKAYFFRPYSNEESYSNIDIEKIIDEQITVKSERKIGKWVLAHPLQENDGGAYVCSCCKSGSYEVIPKTWKACPWCTALMEVDE